MSLNNNNNNNTSSNQFLGRYFQISFHPEHLKYYLLDCGGAGVETFVKIQSEILLKDKTIINIGNSYITVSIGFEEETLFSENHIDSTKKLPSLPNKEYSNNLNLKIETKNVVYDPINFQPSKSAIKIGRNESCEVVVEDHLLSRIHCTIQYRDNVGWVIRDGAFILKDNSLELKPSTNGTWILALEEIPIYEGMVFKYGSNLFRCNYNKEYDS
jgi:pSer/pThr/pTyr-binding forkhead associated (FHA) protein